MSTLFDSLLGALKRSADYNRDDTVPPAAVLWPDEKREWEPGLRLTLSSRTRSFPTAQREFHEQGPRIVPWRLSTVLCRQTPDIRATSFAGRTDRARRGLAKAMPARLPRSLECAARPTGPTSSDRGKQRRANSRVDPPAPRPHAAVAIHVLSRDGAQHGGGPGRHPHHEPASAGVRRCAPGQFPRLCHSRAAGHLRHSRP